MDDPRSHALSFEAVKISMRQTKDGHAMVLAIHPDDIPDALFRTPVGARYQVAMVLLSDDGSPISPIAKPVVERDDRVQYAVMLCKEPLFQEWADQTDGVYDTNEGTARLAILARCGITSRSELRTNVAAQAAFDQMVADYRRAVGF